MILTNKVMILTDKLVTFTNKVVIFTDKSISHQALALPPLVELLKKRLPEVPGDLSNGQPGARVKDRWLELCQASRGRGKKDDVEGAQEEKRAPHDCWSETVLVTGKK